MTIFAKNSIFTPASKYIKFNNKAFNVIDGANVISALPLCELKMDYKQYQRVSIQIPKGQENFILSFPMLGIKPTFIAITPTYGGSLDNYMKWKFQSSADAKSSFTDILVLTGTASNPIPPIVLDNPSTTCDIQLEVLVAANDNDYLNDVSALLYLDNLLFTNIRTYNETNSQILAYINSEGNLAGTTDIADVISVNKMPNQNRIIIVDASVNNIVLDFVTKNDTLQALSAINWLLLDPVNRALPQPADITPPTIVYTPNVVNSSITIDLVTYPSATFSKQDFIDYALLSASDTRDGNIAVLMFNISFKNGTTDIINIVDVGNFTAYISVSDIAGNVTNEVISITAELNIIDVTPPVITYTNSIIGNAASLTLADYYGTITANDIKVLALLSIIDDVDGPIPSADVSVQISDDNPTVIPNITSVGIYSILFTVSDNAGNTTNQTITLIIT